MLYQLAHYIQYQHPWLWTRIEGTNALLFRWRYGRAIQSISLDSESCVSIAQEQDAETLVTFFAHQPQEAYTYFHPHGFDRQSIQQLLRNPSMLMFVAWEQNQIIGYAFLRGFFIGKAYRGYMVDMTHRGQGIGKQLGKALNLAQRQLGIRTYKTISPQNTASLRLGQSICQLVELETLTNGDIYYECKLS